MSHIKFINDCSLFLVCCSFKLKETIQWMIFFWLHKSRLLKHEKGTTNEEQICRKDAGCWEGTKRNFSKSIRILNCQYWVAVGWTRIFNSMAEKWEEVLDRQKNAPHLSKWSATGEIKFAKLTSHPNYFCRHSTRESSLDHKETGQ